MYAQITCGPVLPAQLTYPPAHHNQYNSELYNQSCGEGEGVSNPKATYHHEHHAKLQQALTRNTRKKPSFITSFNVVATPQLLQLAAPHRVPAL